MIPSSPNKKPYEISIDTTYERNESHTANNQRDLADDKNDDADNERREGGSIDISYGFFFGEDGIKINSATHSSLF